jgi:hypothetical protein
MIKGTLHPNHYTEIDSPNYGLRTVSLYFAKYPAFELYEIKRNKRISSETSIPAYQTLRHFKLQEYIVELPGNKRMEN